MRLLGSPLGPYLKVAHAARGGGKSPSASIDPKRPKAYDLSCTRLKDSETPDAFRGGNPATHSFPRPYRPGEDGVLGSVRSVPPSKTTKPRDPPRPVDLGFFLGWVQPTKRPLNENGYGGCNPPYSERAQP